MSLRFIAALLTGMFLSSAALAADTVNVDLTATLPAGVSGIPIYVMIDNKAAPTNGGLFTVPAAGLHLSFTGNWPGTSAHEVGVKLNTYTSGEILHVFSSSIDGRTVNGADLAKVAWSKMEFPVSLFTAPFVVGVNLSGLEMNSGKKPGKASTDYAVIKPTSLDYYAGKGIKLIRLPILWERLQPNIQAATPSYAPNAAYLKYITDVLDHAATIGATVIVDIHNYGNYNAVKMGGTGAVSAAQFQAAWTAIATALNNHVGLAGLDLMNEPNGFPTGDVWPALAQAGINGIRAVDKSDTIYVEGDAYASASGWATHSQTLNKLVDPSGKLVFQAHAYGDRDGSGTHFKWADEVATGKVSVDTIAQRVDVFGQWCKTNHVRCMIGEIGVGNDNAAWNTELANGIAKMKVDGLESMTYWAGGPWWGANYPMSVEPLNGADRSQLPTLVSAETN